LPGLLAHNNCSILSYYRNSQVKPRTLYRKSRLLVPSDPFPRDVDNGHRKGVADEELAKREAERARKRERELDEDAALRDSPPPRRHRSPSYDSISSISTRSPSPAPRRTRSPERQERRREYRSPSPRGSHGRNPSYDSCDRYSRGPSESPARGYQARGSRLPLSPSPRRSPPARSERGGREVRRYGSPGFDVRGKDSYTRRAYSSSRSRSPVRREGRGDRHGPGRYRDRDDRGHRGRSPSLPPPPAPAPRQPSPPRQRSLSPFSKRLALTQAMGRGR
jgi:hypothetical protein